MKKLRPGVATLFFLVAAGKITPQKLLSVLHEDWDGSSWTNSSMLSYSYNASQQVTLTLYQGWDAPTNSWKAGSRTSYTVDINGNPVTSLVESWDNSSSSWTPAALIQMTYTLTNKLLTQTASNWTGNAWQNSTMHNQKYDGSGAIIETNYDTWNTGNASWQNVAMVSYTNNANGDPLSMLYFSWNNNTWVNNSLMSFTYAANNKVTNGVSQHWMNNAWQNYSSATYSYNTNGQLISTLGKMWIFQTAVFENNNREDNTYHSSGHIDQSTNLYWDKTKSSWYFFTRRTNNYDFIPNAIIERNKENLMIYPNPASSAVCIYIGDEPREMILSDEKGQTIKNIKAQPGRNVIDTSELPAGNYILYGSGYCRRIIKQ